MRQIKERVAIIPELVLEKKEREPFREQEQEISGRSSTPVEWNEEEKCLFSEMFQKHPKDFGTIATSLEAKTAMDCVQYYYLSKKKVNYKAGLQKTSLDWATRWALKQKEFLKAFKAAGHDVDDRMPAEKTKKGRPPGTVVDHEKKDGPPCPKCDQICKDSSNFKNHLLSHYYTDFYEVTPSKKPFACPTCGKENRDRITLIRHYAFKHNMLFELTDVTPEMMR